MENVTYLNETSQNYSLPADFTCSSKIEECQSGLILKPTEHPSTSGTIAYQAVIYLSLMAYLLFGANIISDRIVAAIQVIMAQKRKVKVTNSKGEVVAVEVPIWHHTVGHLTLNVIGTSATEVFLPTIEVVWHNFRLNSLGPAIVLGSGAYHLFFNTGICIGSVRGSASKAVQEQRVVAVTGVFAVFSYLWLYVASQQISPGYIEIWEAVVTIMLFPVVVVAAWCAEKRSHIVLWRKLRRVFKEKTFKDDQREDEIDISAIERKKRQHLAALLNELRINHPTKSQQEIEEMAELTLLEKAPKSAAFYKMQASKSMSGSGNVISLERIKKALVRSKNQGKSVKNALKAMTTIEFSRNRQLVGFQPTNYTVMENCGQAILTVTRSGYGVDFSRLTVNFQTVESTGKYGHDFVENSGQITFQTGQMNADIFIDIIDDDEFEEDKEFYVVLSQPRVRFAKAKNTRKISSSKLTFSDRDFRAPVSPSGTNLELKSARQGEGILEDIPEITLQNHRAKVTILDDDHCGVFHFEMAELSVPNNAGVATIKVIRSSGARGCIELPFKVSSASAVMDDDFVVPQRTNLCFDNDEFEQAIKIKIKGEPYRFKEELFFYIELEDPLILSKLPKNSEGKPYLGNPNKVTVSLCEDVEMNESLNRLLKAADISELLMSTTWADQFREVFALPQVDPKVNDSPATTPKSAVLSESSTEHVVTVSYGTCQSRLKLVLNGAIMYFIYGISLPWKLVVALVPPPRYLHGWLAFMILMVLIGFVSSVIGDLAIECGCILGVKEAVIATTLVAFGMGLPDTLATRHAAIYETTADAGIGHITGTNAVTVFLGIGMSWTVASIYQYFANDASLKIPPSNAFGFTVTIYCVFAFIGILVLLLKRLPPINGELGGPLIVKYTSASFFVILWLAFVILVILDSYCVIDTF